MGGLHPPVPLIFRTFDTSDDKIIDNAKEFLSVIQKLKPSAAKGTYIKSIYLSTTMSPGLKVDPKSFEE